MTEFYKDLVQPDDEPRFITRFQILTEDRLPFKYIVGRNGICTADSDASGLAQCEVLKYIHIVEENIPADTGRFHGGPEPCLNGDALKFVQPCDDAFHPNGIGKDLEIKDFGGWKCQRCGYVSIIHISSDNQHIHDDALKMPFECLNEDCGRKGPFKPEFPKHLTKPIWKVPLAPIESAGVEIYSDIYAYCKEHLVLEEEDYHIITLWLMASWLVDDFQTCPYLCVLAPKESGKSQLLEVISELGYRTTKTISVTASALFRAIELWHVTLLIDEAEYQLKQETEAGQALYGCLNGGYKRGSYAIRIEGETGSRIPTAYDVFGFKAIATTQLFHPTLESRSIIINMSQGMPNKVLIDTQRGAVIRSKLLFWRFETLTKLPIVLPESNRARLIEMFIPLFTVAQTLKDKEGVKTLIEYNELINVLNNRIKSMEVIRKEEERSSEDAQIIEALYNLTTRPPQGGVTNERAFVSIREIGIELRWIDEYTEQKDIIKTLAKIGKKLKVMGLKVKHSMHGNVVDYQEQNNSDKLKELLKRFFTGNEGQSCQI